MRFTKNSISFVMSTHHLTKKSKLKLKIILYQQSTFRMLDGTSPSRETFMSILSNIEAILIRATYHTLMGSASLRDLYMETSTSNPTNFGRMPQIESCQCPEGHTGSSCEQCAPGYLLQEDGVGRRCVRCSCNNHADSCDTRTGQCLVSVSPKNVPRRMRQTVNQY